MKPGHFCVLASVLMLGLALLFVENRARAAGDPAKILRMAISSGESGFDPATASDVNSLSICENIFDAMLRYEYLTRPVKLQANTLSQMPEVSGNGTTCLLHIRPGIFFTPDPAFKGRPRELIAQDYIYSIKRLYDPILKSPWLFLFQGKIEGDRQLGQGASLVKFNYDTQVEGLQAVDRYTLRIRLVAPDSNFLFALALPATGAVAREVIQSDPDQAGNHPIGTGPFLLHEWRRSSKLVLLANPEFRDTVFQGKATSDVNDLAISSALNGKRLPRVARVEIRIIEDEQSRLLSFLGGNLDYLERVSPSLSKMVLSNLKLKPELASQGIQLSLFSPLQTNYMWMNMDDRVIGGYGLDRLALRRAIGLSYNREEDIRLLEGGLALAAQSPLPPGVLGFDPSWRNSLGYDPVLARALLDRFGYERRDREGYRQTPEGRPLTLVMHTVATATSRLRDEAWRKSLDSIGLRIVFKSDKRSEIIKASRLGKVQMYETNWVADTPDADNFFQLLYGPNSSRANYARFRLPAYDMLYHHARLIGDSPQRQFYYRDMNRLIHAYTPWVLLTHPLSADLRQARIKNYKRHPIELTTWRYLDIDGAPGGNAVAGPTSEIMP